MLSTPPTAAGAGASWAAAGSGAASRASSTPAHRPARVDETARRTGAPSTGRVPEGDGSAKPTPRVVPVTRGCSGRWVRNAPPSRGLLVRTAPRLVWVLLAALLLPALPSVAATRLPAVVEPLLRTTALTAGVTEALLDRRDHLVGVTWSAGAPRVDVRWHLPTGWTAWEPAEPDDATTPSHEPGGRAGRDGPGHRAAVAPDGRRPGRRPGGRRGRRARPGARGRRTDAGRRLGPRARHRRRARGRRTPLPGCGRQPSRLGRGRAAAARQPVVRLGGAGRRRAPHGRQQRLPAGGRPGQDPCRLRVPRQGTRLGRPRLQPRRRPVRPDLGGPRRRARPGDRRHPRRRLQHRHARRLRPRRLHEGHAGPEVVNALARVARTPGRPGTSTRAPAST
jgi:hypothetical protein